MHYDKSNRTALINKLCLLVGLLVLGAQYLFANGSGGSMGGGPFKIDPPETILSTLEEVVGPRAENPQAFSIDSTYYKQIMQNLEISRGRVIIRVMHPKTKAYQEFNIKQALEVKLDGLPAILGVLEDKESTYKSEIVPVLLFEPSQFNKFNKLYNLEY